MFNNRRTFALLALSLLALLAFASWKYKVLQLGYYWWSMLDIPVAESAHGIWLPNYRVRIEAKPINGVEENVPPRLRDAASASSDRLARQVS